MMAQHWEQTRSKGLLSSVRLKEEIRSAQQMVLSAQVSETPLAKMSGRK